MNWCIVTYLLDSLIYYLFHTGLYLKISSIGETAIQAEGKHFKIPQIKQLCEIFFKL